MLGFRYRWTLSSGRLESPIRNKTDKTHNAMCTWIKKHHELAVPISDKHPDSSETETPEQNSEIPVEDQNGQSTLEKQLEILRHLHV